MSKKINRRGREGSQRVVVSLFRPSALSAVFRIAQKMIKSLQKFDGSADAPHSKTVDPTRWAFLTRKLFTKV